MRKVLDLTGKVFGRLTVINFSHIIKSKGTFWNCRCSCGQLKTTTSNRLRRGQTASCGCLAQETRGICLRLNLIGRKFNKLEVISLSHLNKTRTYWNCRCDCGKLAIVIGSNLMKGNSTSCGCIKNKHDEENRVFSIVYSRYKCDAKKLGRAFEISYDDFKILLKSNCYYCGTEPSNHSAKNNNTIKYASVDRIDSNKGYINNNVRSSCKMCNIMKLNHTEDVFKMQISKIFNYWVK